MANYTSLEQAQSALGNVNQQLADLQAKRDILFADQYASLDKLNGLKSQADELIKIKDNNSFLSSAYQDANQQLRRITTEIINEEKTFASIKSNIRETNTEQNQIYRNQDQIDNAIRQFETPGDVVTDVTAVNDDPNATVALEKQRDATVNDASDSSTYGLSSDVPSSIGLRGNLSVPFGAEPRVPQSATVNFTSMSSSKENEDMRVKIRVPKSYLTTLTSGPKSELQILGGIIFPYAPQVSYEHIADYGTQNPTHSNYTSYFYKNSKVGPIEISGVFTVQNEQEAEIYMATVHLLRALTKMKSGGATGDFDSGAPPPVCRLDAYGAFMLQNVPVVISRFKMELPNNVDYFTWGKDSFGRTSRTDNYEKTAVPVHSTISVTCLPVYSRDEMQKFNVTQWNTNKYVRKAGYL